MIITTTDHIAGKTISEVVGVVEGSVVMSKHIGSDIAASFRTLVGGEIKGYTDMMDKSRKQATERMTAAAKKIGADAIIGMRFASATIMGGASEMLAYGTAVKLKK